MSHENKKIFHQITDNNRFIIRSRQNNDTRRSPAPSHKLFVFRLHRSNKDASRQQNFLATVEKKDLGEKLKASTASMNYSKYSKSKNDSTEKKLTKTGQENQIDFSGKLR